MQKSALVKVFLKLTPKDRRELHKFVRSPFFNQREDVVRLFDYLNEKVETEDLSKGTVFGHLFPEEPYDDDRLRLVMHFLLNNIRRYLAWSEIGEDETALGLHLCRALRRRSLDRPFERTLGKLHRRQEKQPHRNVGYHYQNYQLHLERYLHAHRQRRSGPMHLQEVTDELTAFYLADILRHGCTILTARSMSAEGYDLRAAEYAIGYLREAPGQPPPAVRVYYRAFLALSEPEDESHFTRLKEEIRQHWRLFPTEEARDLFLLAINYCIGRLNQGRRAYIREAFELYRAGLAEQVLVEEGRLSKFTYNNVLMLAVALEEWTWAEGFLETYRSYLSPAERENVYRYNRAVYFFRKPDYDRAMRLLQQVTFRDVLYNLDARRMLLRMYYELGEYDALESLLDSFATFLRRRSDLGYHREHYRNLVGYVRRMLRLQLMDQDLRRNLRAEVEAAQAVAEKEWLLEMLG